MQLLFLRIILEIITLYSNDSKTTQPPENNIILTSININSEEGNTPLGTSPTFDIDYLLGKFDPATHPDFAKIPLEVTNKENVYLRKEVLEAFVNMRKAAIKDGVSLKIISATRNFQAQKGIWEAKWNGNRLVEGENLSVSIKNPAQRAIKILRYSSMPGTSRHHWGTDIDINDLTDSYFLSGKGKKEYEWLVKNAGKYGFCQVYSPKGEQRPQGYEEEKWHWSYIPTSEILLEQYQAKVKPEDIKGFQGAETAQSINVIQNYVLGINSDLR
jgi:LAS superfamily LD-carboxypeptidase LdcB